MTRQKLSNYLDVTANQPAKNPKGRLWMNSFHVSPDNFSVHCFDTKENMENFLPLMKERIENFATKFECKFTIETGILVLRKKF